MSKANKKFKVVFILPISLIHFPFILFNSYFPSILFKKEPFLDSVLGGIKMLLIKKTKHSCHSKLSSFCSYFNSLIYLSLRQKGTYASCSRTRWMIRIYYNRTLYS